MMTPKEIIHVVSEFEAGKEIECCEDSDIWETVKNPNWNFGVAKYRVKRKPRVFWGNLATAATVGLFYENESDARACYVEGETIKLIEWLE